MLFKFIPHNVDILSLWVVIVLAKLDAEVVRSETNPSMFPFLYMYTFLGAFLFIDIFVLISRSGISWSDNPGITLCLLTMSG